METKETRIHSARLNEIKNRFSVQDSAAKKPYMRPIRVIAPAYMPTVEPTSTNCQKLLSETSHFSRQVSDHEWAKSTRRTKPRMIKMQAPMSVT